MSALRSVCVFCGARPGSNPAHVQAARDTGALIGRQGWRLVYGAGDVGLMGEVARAAMAAGAATMGVIPTHLIGAEQANRSADHSAGRADPPTPVITQTMHERKKVMFMNADAVVLLPGGAGSLDEFFEVLTWAQIGLHAKPILLFNNDGYWAPLIALLDHVVDQGFAARSMLNLFTVVPDIAALGMALHKALTNDPSPALHLHASE